MNVLGIALAGLFAGFLHVFAGPDHLAAIAPMSVHKDSTRALWMGVRWGVGHSLGVLLVGLTALFLRGVLPMEALSSTSERLVGVMLVAIGAWGFWKLFAKAKVGEHEHAGGVRHTHAFRKDVHAHAHAALPVGILHGLAGGSHLFGVLPALALETRVTSVTYLIVFGVGTVAAMGLYAAVISGVVRKTPRAERALLGVSSACAIMLGVFWVSV